MYKIFNLNILITLACMMVTAEAIYVPEHTKNEHYMDSAHVKNMWNEENKQLQLKVLQQQSVNLNADVANNFNVHNNDVGANNDGQQKLFIEQTLLNIRTPQKSYDIVGGDDDVVNAKPHTIQNVHENLEAQPTGLTEQQSSQQQQQKHVNYNNDVALNEQPDDESNKDSLATLLHSREKRQLSDFLIAPNTRWCGRGNTANGTYNHLGGASMADKCCRTHDHCKLYIPAMSNRFDLFNYRPYTLSHCNCDRRFRTCLKMANDEDANTIGKLFFNLVQTQCFVLTKEVVCQKRDSDGTCIKEHVKQKAYLRYNKKY